MKIAIIVGIVLCTAQGIFGGCPSGWTGEKANCYKLFTTPLTNGEALLVCKANLGTLAEPLTAAENTKVKAVAGGRKIWFGINDVKKEGQFVYTNSGFNLGNNFWAGGEPNNKYNENCAEMYSSGKWNDQQCTDKLPFVCQTAN